MKLLTKTFLGTAALLQAISAFGWGEKGHNIVAHVAQAHLSAKAQHEVRQLLGGHNMAYYSTWADNLRGDSTYKHTFTWHYINVDDGYTYATMPKNPDGDVLTATLLCVEQLRLKGQSDSLRNMYLKLLIHMVGDMHCPMHAGRLSDRGGNLYPIIFRNDTMSLHRLWDSPLINAAHTWSGIEWATNIDFAMDAAQTQRLQSGTPLDWVEETMALAKDIYANCPQNKSLSYAYVNHYTPVVEAQLLKGGYRLARLLNEIFEANP
ncbi:MAG: S1/P1 nuclease [Prevotellaceae bacterium]|jgi:hypothetical protein|nr:S1/P1 nuclease [Prevotellaceae bacterium]